MTLRFAMLTTFYPPYNFGGDGISVERLSRALARRGHHVTVIHDVDAYALLRPGPLPDPTTADTGGVDVIRLRSRLGALSPLLTQQTGHPLVHGRRIRRLLDTGRFDVIMYHNVSLIGGPGLLSAGQGVKLYMAHEHWLVCPTHVLWRHRREPCPARQCLRCVLYHRRPPQLWRYTGLLQRQLHHVSAFIAMSDFSRTKHQEFGFPRPMEVLPYFLPDAEPPAPDPDASPHPRPYFLFVGRLERIKGLDDVIPVFHRYQDADLVIAGEGTHGDILRRLAAECPRVRFVGRLAGDVLRRYYRHALALIVPSVCYETFGIILIEAFREGVPVIARDIGPFPEIVRDSGGGFLFRTPQELVGAMDRLRADPGARARLGGLAREGFRQRWSESAVIPRFLDVVRRAALDTGHDRVARLLAGNMAS